MTEAMSKTAATAEARQMRPDEMHRTPVQREVDAMLAEIEAARAIPAYVEPLTADDYERLTSGRNVCVTHGAATLALGRIKPHSDERRFVMTGPSGTHSLAPVATPLDRLNAHWIVFASHPANQ